MQPVRRAHSTMSQQPAVARHSLASLRHESHSRAWQSALTVTPASSSLWSSLTHAALSLYGLSVVVSVGSPMQFVPMPYEKRPATAMKRALSGPLPADGKGFVQEPVSGVNVTSYSPGSRFHIAPRPAAPKMVSPETALSAVGSGSPVTGSL